MPIRDLEGVVCVCAGASSGMGRATARALAAGGADLLLTARNAEALEKIVAELTPVASGRILASPADSRDGDAVGRVFNQALDAFGRVDALVNTVGTNIAQRSLLELTPESWAGMLDSNLTAAFNLTRSAVQAMRPQGDGLIVHVSSAAARRPDRSGAAYQATKAGVAALAHATMEEERANGIRVTVIYPGFTDTPLVLNRPTPPTPAMLERALQPEDVAAACLFVVRLPARAHVPELVLVPSR
jgi:NADP-dependent 3-hydroxy acid dehydrogenase YdfG